MAQVDRFARQLHPAARIAVGEVHDSPRSDLDQPQHRLAETAARYLGPIRTAERYDLHLPVLWGVEGRESRTEDISATGALIVCETADRPATGRRFELALVAPDGPINLPSEVVRHTEPDSDKVRGFAVTWIRAGAHELEKLEAILAAER